MTSEQFRKYCKKHVTPKRLVNFKGAFYKSKAYKKAFPVPLKKAKPIGAEEM